MGLFSSVWKAVTKPFKKILSWLVPTPDTPNAQAVTVEKQGSDHAIPVVYGTRRIGGIKVHKYVTDANGGAKNEFLHLIIVFCEGEIDAISELYFDGVSEHDARWNKKGGGKWFTVQRKTGADDQLALVTGIPNWTSSHRLQGLAYIHLRLQMDENQSVWRGEPEVTALIRGKKILDPRTGVTAYSENLPLQLLDYLTNSRYGKGMLSSRLMQQSFIDAATWADVQLTSTVTINGVATPTTYSRITGNLVVDTSKSVFSNVKLMLSGMRGMLPIGSGLLRLVPEKEGEPVFFFTHNRSENPNSARIESPIKSKSGRKNDRYNRVIIRFPNKLTNYERDEVHYPNATDPIFEDWMAEDNGVLLEQSFEFDTITNKAEAYQMAEIIAKRSRNRTEVSFTASPAAIVVEPGDIVGITDDTRGWAEKPFLVDQCKLREDGTVDFEFIEHQNAIYPWSGVDYSDRVGGTNLGDPTQVAAVTDLVFIPDVTFDSTGQLKWDNVSDAFVRSYVVVVEQNGVQIQREQRLSKYYTVPKLGVGSYEFTVYARSTLGYLSPASTISLVLDIPAAPTAITTSVGNFHVSVYPALAGHPTAEFKVYGSDYNDFATATLVGVGRVVTDQGLKPDSLRYYWASTTTWFADSDLFGPVSAVTLKDPSQISDLLSNIAEYSPDGIEDWSRPYRITDKWMRLSYDNGLTFDDPVKITGEDGASGNFVDYLFASSQSKPPLPSASPEIWFDTPQLPPVWMSKALKASDGELIGSWSSPVKLSGDSGQDGVSYWLTRSASVIKLGANNSYDINAVTVQSWSQVGLQPAQPYFGLFKIKVKNTNGLWSDVYSSSYPESSKTIDVPQNITTIQFQLFDQSNLKMDEESTIIVEDGVSLDVHIESSNGTIFRPGQGRSTLLIARVFRNAEDITEQISPSKFRWRRVSQDPQPPPNDDSTWNASYNTGFKQVMVSVDDVAARATFFCEILE
jgi:hypothetical protein